MHQTRRFLQLLPLLILLVAPAGAFAAWSATSPAEPELRTSNAQDLDMSFADVERGREVILELARRVVAMGGSPLAEHGVGRNPVKQQLLEMLYGREGVESMRRVKLSLDSTWKLAPGLLFEEVTPFDAG